MTAYTLTACTPCRGQVLWITCQKIRQSAQRLSLLLHKILMQSAHEGEVLLQKVSTIMGLDKPIMRMAVLEKGPRAPKVAIPTVHQELYGLMRQGLDVVQEHAAAEDASIRRMEDAQLALDMAHLGRRILITQKRQAMGSMPAANVAQMAMTLMRAR